MNTPERSFLSRHLEKLDSLYSRFGRDGLKHCVAADVLLLLSAKELALNEVSERLSAGEKDAGQIALKNEMQLTVQDLARLAKERGAEKARAVDKSHRPERGMER